MARLFFPESSPPLEAGARIGCFSPAFPFHEERLALGLELLREWGYEPVLAPGLGGRHRYFAGDDRARLADLLWALGDDSLDAAWLTRGGYGLLRLVGMIPETGLRKDRLVMGFSDATLLLEALRGRGYARAIHGPVLQTLARHIDDASRLALWRLLDEGRSGPWDLHLLQGAGELPVEGPLLGGNLCTLVTLCGTPFAFSARGAILLIEEVREAPYRVDRMLTQLRLSGALQGVRAVVLGEFTGCDPVSPEEGTLEELFLDRLGDLGVPLLRDAPVGHGARNEPFPVGAKVRIEP
jgi:muramoyltetrapeptide carboxypeptidase